MRRTAWIWLAGALAWMFDGLVSVRVHAAVNAELAFLISLLFTIAWLFFRQQRR